MKCSGFLLVCFLLAALVAVHAQSSNGSQAAWNAYYAKQSTVRKRGTEALEREQAQSKANLCQDAEKGGNAAIGACLTKESQATEKDYLTYVRAIGFLLRSPGPDVSRAKPPKALPFDTAEDLWRRYRHESCDSVSSQWDGGDQAGIAYADCRLRLTWNHMDELSKLYSDLWH